MERSGIKRLERKAGPVFHRSLLFCFKELNMNVRFFYFAYELVADITNVKF